MRPGRLGAKPLGVIAGGHEERGGGVNADTVQRQQAGCGLRHQISEQLVDAFDLLVEGQDPAAKVWIDSLVA